MNIFMKKKQKQAHRYRDQIIGYQKGWGSGGRVKWVKGVDRMVMGGNQTCGGDHFVVYKDVKL